MTEKIKKTEIVYQHSFGNGDFIMITRSPSGYYSGYGSVSGKNISTENQYKYPKYVKREFIKNLKDANINLINDANKCEEIVFAIKENKESELEKKFKDLKEKK